ncbi:MAG: DUF1641 domain-containing protein [Kineosporiaceae bacterium]|nr:DUF1641 domain-containing protein [Kineosporiaceae bacterium]MBK7625061.1 DUF1641 domain-containing protein [Kineosporiaceae bacterium]
MSTATTVPVDQAVDLAHRLDRIEAQLVRVSDQLEATALERDRWRELTHELMPVAQGAMTVASRELEELSTEVTVEDLLRFARTAVRALPQLEALLSQVGPASELVHEATSLTGAGVGALSSALAQAEEKGYFTFLRGGAHVANEVVTSFGEEDLKALGANVVLILKTVQQMTQPQIMHFLSTAISDIQEVDEAPPPSAVKLLSQMRDPQVRRGLSRTLAVLGDLGAAGEAEPGARKKSKDHKNPSRKG